MNYAVRSGDTPDELSREVNLFIKNGWVPHGSMLLHQNNGMSKLYQPMTRINVHQQTESKNHE